MTAKMKRLLSEIRDKEMRELVRDHVRDVRFDENAHKALLFVDKRAYLHTIKSHPAVRTCIDAVKRIYGAGTETILRLKAPHRAHDREMLVPLFIHYR